MQIIADGKIKEGQIINRIADNGDVYRYIFEDDGIRLYDGTDIFKIMPLCSMLSYHFEILEDKTEEIEEIKRINKSYAIFGFDDKSFKEMKEMLQDLYEKTNELVRAVNKLKIYLKKQIV